MTEPEMQQNTNQSAHLFLAGSAFVLFVSVFSLYWPVGQYGFFILDDAAFLIRNIHIQEGLTMDGVKWAMTGDLFGNDPYLDYWQPVTALSRLLDRQFFGADPGPQHFVNVLFHALNSILVLLLVFTLCGRKATSVVAAGVFAFHPLQVESVVWLTERKDVLFAFFYLLACLVYVKGNGKMTWGRFLGVTALFILSIMSKPMAVTLPAVLLIFDWLLFSKLKQLGWKRCVLEKIPLFLLSLGSLAITLLRQKHVAIESVPLSERVMAIIASYGIYIKKILLPIDQVPIYSPFQFPIELTLLMTSLLSLMAISYAIYRMKSEAPLAASAWLWFLITLLPVVALTETMTADRFTYIPIIGVGIVFGVLFDKFRLAGSAAAVVVLLACYFASAQYISLWEDNAALFEHTILKTENNSKAHSALGKMYLDKKELSMAAQHFGKAVEYDSRNRQALNNYGVALFGMGKMDAAEKQFNRYLFLNPEDDEARANLGVAYFAAGRLSEADSTFADAIARNPRSSLFYSGAAMVKQAMGDPRRASAYFEKAISLEPSSHSILNNYAWLRATTKDSTVRRPQLAVELAEKACRLTGRQNPGYLDTLAVAYAADGKYDSAVVLAKTALRMSAKESNSRLGDAIQEHIRIFENGDAYFE